MNKKILQGFGIAGNIIGMILMPCCFPLFVSLLALVGVKMISIGPVTLYIILVSTVIMTISHGIHARQTRQYIPLVISVISSICVAYYLFGSMGQVWFYYCGLIGLSAVSLYYFIMQRRSKHCGSCA